MKKRKIYFILMMIIILLSLNITTFAIIDTQANNGTITITGLEAGVKVYFYKLTTVDYNSDTDQLQDPAYTWVEEIRSWIKENYPDYIDEANDSVTDSFSDEIVESSTATSFYSKLASAIKGGECDLSVSFEGYTDGDPEYPVTSENTVSSITASNLDMGTYLIIIENGYRVYTPVVANLLPEYDEESESWILNNVVTSAKSTAISISKTIEDTEVETDTINYSTSDIINYKIVADIPTYEEDSISTDYIITDTIESGISLDESSISVYGIKGTYEAELSDDAYSLKITDNGFVVEFVYELISEYESIKITYTGGLMKDSSLVLSEEGNINSAILIYSNNPYSEDSLIYQASNKVTVYTYGIELQKVDKNSGESLTGAEFNLLDSKGTAMYFIYVEGIYYPANATDTDSTSTLIVDDEGMLYIYGLDAGKYVLEETKAPAGYLIATNTVTIKIVDDNLDGIIDDDTDAIYSIKFTNTESFVLPVTGGIGSIIFTIIGIIFIAIGIFLIIFKIAINKKLQSYK